MDKIFSTMLEIGIYSGVIVLIVLLLRLVFHKASKAVICALWFLVGLRLLLFIPIESSFAVIPRLSIKEMVREYSESTDMIQPQGTDGVVIYDNGLNEDGSVVSAQNNLDNQDSTESIVGLKSGNAYKYENSESSKSFNDEELIQPTQETLSSKSAQTKQENRFNIFSILAFVWLGGVVAMFSYAIIKAIKVKRRLLEAVRLEGYDDVYLTDYVRNAFVFGLIRPRIYLNYFVTGEQRKYVLAHEREHIARKDYFFKVAAYVLLSLYWFVPWIWVAFIMYSRDMELACDEGVIRTMDSESRARYAETLFGCSVSGFDRAYNVVSFGELGVNERVKNIMKYKKKTVWISVAAGLVAVLCLMFFLTPKNANAESEVSEDKHDKTVSVDESIHVDNVISETKQKNGYGLELYKEYFDESTGKLTLPEGVERINDRAFLGCTQIQVVELPSSVKSIGTDAFELCTNLSRIDMPDGLVEIGKYAFKSCSSLTYVLCPSTLEKIGTRAFMNCKSLLKVSLSEKILESGEEIEDNAFSGCYSLLDEYKEQILSVNPKAYQVDAIDATSDLTNVEYSRKENAPDKFQMRLDNPYDSFYVVIYAMDNGDIICEDYHWFPYEEKVDYLGEKKRYKLADDCKIIVQAKDVVNNGKICYIDKEELAYIARVYGFVRPDGSHESYVKSEYVYPFLCVMDQNHEVRALRECYDIFGVSKNLYDKVKNTNLTQKQIEELDKRLKQEGVTEYEICNAQELCTNKAGQTYGDPLLHADLIPAKGINGNLGYVNEDELAPTHNSIEEVIGLPQNSGTGQIIPLYNLEGEVIDGFVVGVVSDEEIEAYCNGLNIMK
ncbi:MAG: leucine-rich repeat protein [Lachnospiraceae bacterium]|nr:leucine-rich repeat protein [Lachnospiraceae bacterium]